MLYEHDSPISYAEIQSPPQSKSFRRPVATSLGGSRGPSAEHHRQHDQEVEQDARVHLSNLRDAQRCIDQCCFGRHEDEVCRHQEYEQEYKNPDSALKQIDAGNAVAETDQNPEGPPSFTRALRTL